MNRPTFSGYATNFQAAVFTLANNSAAISKVIPNPTTVMTLMTFPDGSSAVAEYDFGARAFVYVKGSSKDQYGNPIPENPTAAAGGANSIQNYTYPGTVEGVMTGAQMESNLKNIGAIFSGDVYNVSGDFLIACINANGTTTCSVRLR